MYVTPEQLWLLGDHAKSIVITEDEPLIVEQPVASKPAIQWPQSEPRSEFDKGS